MKKEIKTKWNDLWPIINILNEVCHGIKINDFETEIGFNYNEIFSLLAKLEAYEVGEDMSEIQIILELNNIETEILKACFNESLKQIEQWEFSTRIGVSISEAQKIKEKLTKC